MFGVIQTIPLSATTRGALKQAGAVLLRRDRTLEEIKDWVERNEPEFLIQMGLGVVSHEDVPVTVYNCSFDVMDVMTPGALRRSMGVYLPREVTWDYLNRGGGVYADVIHWVWKKGPGHGGSNKVKLGIKPNELATAELLSWLPAHPNWDLQVNVVGLEYRVLTVGPKIVQSFVRTDSGADPTHRTYGWVGVQSLPGAVKTVVWDVARARENLYTVSGMDVIRPSNGDRVKLLEINSSPGMNTATAQRVVHAIRTQLSGSEE